VAAQAADSTSTLALYQALTRLRRSEAALSVGDYRPGRADETVLTYERHHGGRRLIVTLNTSGQAQFLSGLPAGRLLVSTALDRAGEPTNGDLALMPDEGCVIALD
jgi:alpha-glucosidase